MCSCIHHTTASVNGVSAQVSSQAAAYIRGAFSVVTTGLVVLSLVACFGKQQMLAYPSALPDVFCNC